MAVSLDLLRTFLVVYREGSLTRAAERLSLAQPTVTVQIRTLETRIGRPLFERQPRGVTPTPAADLLARRIAAPMDLLDGLQARGDLLEEGAVSPLEGVVHLGGPVEFVTAKVLPALAPLVEQGLQLRVSLGMSEDLVRALSTGGVDIAVLTIRSRARGLTVEPLCDEEFVLVGGARVAETLPRDPPPVELAKALHGVPLVSYAEALPIVRRYWQTVFETRPQREAAVVVPDLRAVLATLATGTGFSVLPTYLCAEEIAAGRVVVLHQPLVAPLNTLFLASRAGAAASPAAATVREVLLRAGKQW